jgi:succinyl-diaminopimelate desuccinylase
LNLAKKLGMRLQIEKLSDTYKLTLKGTAAHASVPHKGTNAAILLISLITRYFPENQIPSLLTLINTYIGSELDGKTLGIKQHDEESGSLTLNLGCIKIDHLCGMAKVDIRYPVTSNGQAIYQKIMSTLQPFNLKFTLLDDKPPLFLKKDSKLVNLLKTAYKNITDKDPDIITSGGGTYARSLQGRGVSFGPIFPDENSNMHNVDENLHVENFFLHAQICLEAMYLMLTKR